MPYSHASANHNHDINLRPSIDVIPMMSQRVVVSLPKSLTRSTATFPCSNTAMSTSTHTSHLDATVAKVLDRDRAKHEDSSDEDELLAELEREDAALDGFRERRLQQLHEEFARAQAQRANLGSGTYEDVQDEKAVMDITTFPPLPLPPPSDFVRANGKGNRSNKNAVVHFYHSDFRRCKILDSHLALLAPKHLECRFVRVEVEKAPFLVERLAVRVLPCLLAFVDGKQVGRMEGFERLGNTDTFRTVRLEEVLVASEVLERVRFAEDGGVLGDGEKKVVEEEDSGDDWD
jgi:thiol-disulfide isomerase/thioredoxin